MGMDVDAGFQQMGGKSVTQAVNPTPVFDARRTAGGMVDGRGSLVVERAIAGAIGE